MRESEKDKRQGLFRRLLDFVRPARASFGDNAEPPAASVSALETRLGLGTSTQFPEKRRGTAVDIVVGLDFGTSATKVIVRAPYFGGVLPHVVTFPEVLQAEDTPFLWQTALWVTKNGELSIVPLPGASRINSIKEWLTSNTPQRTLVVLTDGQEVCAWDAAVGYLAYVMRYTRGWFFESKAATYRHSPLTWQCNVGLPAATYDNPELVALYRRTVAAAWVLSEESDAITLSSVRKAFQHPEVAAAETDRDTRARLGIEVVPEVAAEVTGFARSSQRRTGLFAMVDVGAGTVDVCTFRLHSPEQGLDRYSMFTADVKRQGVEILKRLREGRRPINQFIDALDQTMRRVIWHTKCHRDPTADEWRTQLPVFFCGGGRASELHRAAVNKLGRWLADFTQAKDMPVLRLECPEGFETEISSNDFHRVAVAWGLSYPEIDIGELQLPSEIEDLEPRRVRDQSDAFVDKDQV